MILCLCHSVDMERRDLSHKEKLYLREQNVITETQCTLGRMHTPLAFQLFHYMEQNPNNIYSLVPCLQDFLCK